MKGLYNLAYFVKRTYDLNNDNIKTKKMLLIEILFWFMQEDALY